MLHQKLLADSKQQPQAVSCLYSGPIKFDCLGGQTVVAARISDHNPIIYTSPVGVICSFRLLPQCKMQNGDFNNVLRITESDNEYAYRLLVKTIDVIQELATKHQAKYFLLQNAPRTSIPYAPISQQHLTAYNEIGPEFYAKLKLVLPWIFADTNKGLTKVGGVINLYPASVITHRKITDDLKSAKFISPANRDCFQAVAIKDKDGVEFKLINFNVPDYDNPETVDDIQKLITTKQYIIGGCFNLSHKLAVHVPGKAQATDPKLFTHQTFDLIYNSLEHNPEPEQSFLQFLCNRMC